MKFICLIYMYVCMCIWAHVYVSMYVCMCVRASVCLKNSMYVHLSICIGVCMSLCFCLNVYDTQHFFQEESLESSHQKQATDNILYMGYSRYLHIFRMYWQQCMKSSNSSTTINNQLVVFRGLVRSPFERKTKGALAVQFRSHLLHPCKSST